MNIQLKFNNDTRVYITQKDGYVIRGTIDDVQKGDSIRPVIDLSTDPPTILCLYIQDSSITAKVFTFEECVVCLDAPAQFGVKRCGHKCMCGSCSNQLGHSQAACPICRTPAFGGFTEL